MRFVGIWYNMRDEVARDYVSASDSSAASEAIHRLYTGRPEPAECLSVVPADQNGYGAKLVSVETPRGGGF